MVRAVGGYTPSGVLPHPERRLASPRAASCLTLGAALVVASENREDGDTLRRRTEMKIAQLITGKTPITISADSTIQDLVTALAMNRVGALIVSNDGRKIDGIVSERDVVRAMPGDFSKLSHLHVRDLMTVVVVTATPESKVDELMTIMTERRIRHIPIVDDDGALVSIVSIGDIVKSKISELDDERKSLIGYISQ
jgi:CBS domain-containing protein